MTQFFSDSIFWIETGKINPNPFQPRKEFDEARLKEIENMFAVKRYNRNPILMPNNKNYWEAFATSNMSVVKNGNNIQQN